MSFDRREEVESLLASEPSMMGVVWRRHIRDGESLDEIIASMPRKTRPDNELRMIGVVLDRETDVSRWVAGNGIGRLGSWLKKPKLSVELRADFQNQIEELRARLRKLEDSGQIDKSAYELPLDTDRSVLANARKEQGRLRDYLLQGRIEAPCDLCGRYLPKAFLIAAHIVPRTGLGHEERTQFDRIAMIACLFGCDRLFELGYLTVDEVGVVHARPMEGDLGKELGAMSGRRCTAHDANTAKAFAAHRSRFQPPFSLGSDLPI